MATASAIKRAVCVSYRSRAISLSVAEEPVRTSLLSLLVLALVLSVAWSLWERHAEGISAPLPPGNMGWPLLGESHHFFLKGAEFFAERYAKFGNIYKTHILGGPMIRVAGAANLRSLVSKEPQQLTMGTPLSTKYMFGQHSVAVVTGHEHSRLKKKLLTCVSPLRLGDYLPCIQEHMRSHILSWCSEGRVLGFPACEDLMCDIMLELALGWRKEHDAHGIVRAAFVTVNQNLFTFPCNIPGSRFYKANKAKMIIVDFIKKRLASKGDKDHVSMLDVFLISHGQEHGLTEEEIIDNAVTFLLAGAGTTSSALSTSLLMLGKHPEVLTAVRNELDSKGLLTAKHCTDLNYDLIQSLEICQSVCKEILRLHPPVGGMFRRAQTTINLRGYQIPKQWTVMYGIRETQFSTKVFENRDAFLPQRWLDKSLEESLRTTDSYNYLPFGSGPRFCLGKPLALMEMVVFLVEIARLTTWELHNPNAKMVHLPITKAVDNMPVSFTRRTNEI